MPDDAVRFIRVKLPREESPAVAVFAVEIASLGGEVRVADKDYVFEDFTRSLETLTNSLYAAIKKISPTKASIEFGVEVGVESGKLTALLVKGSGKANLKVTLEWN